MTSKFIFDASYRTVNGKMNFQQIIIEAESISDAHQKGVLEIQTNAIYQYGGKLDAKTTPVAPIRVRRTSNPRNRSAP